MQSPLTFKRKRSSRPLELKKEEELEHPCMKVEVDEPPYIKDKEEEAEEEEKKGICKLPLTGVPLKSINEADRGTEPPSSSSCQHMVLEATGRIKSRWPLSSTIADSDKTSSNADDEDEDDEFESDRTCHTGNKLWECPRCGKTFTDKSALKPHMRTHTGEKPFTCSDCGWKFSYKRNLRRHTRTHTGEKRFACTDCGRRFSQKGHVIAHRRPHAGEKPFS